MNTTMKAPLAEFETKWKEIEEEVRGIAQRLLKAYPRLESDIHPSRRWHHVHDAHADVWSLCRNHDMAVFDGVLEKIARCDEAEEMVKLWYRAARYVSAADKSVETDVYPTGQTLELLRINAPAWFKNEKFIEWLNTPGTATWHTQAECSKEPHDFSDVFFTFCQGDGSDSPCGDPDRTCIPEEIWDHLEFVVADRFGWDAEVLVWVSNLE